MIDLTPDDRGLVLRILKRFVPDAEIRAFGSRVTGTSKPWSDLDIAIVASAPVGLRLMAEIRDAFEESSLPFRVDLLDWNEISQSFRQAIESSGFELLR